MSEHLEIERKFEVGDDFRRPDFSAVADGVTASEPVTHHLSATYYDTRDQRLAEAKITLRRRAGGADEGWHMKLPVSDGTRRELREPLSDDLPETLAERAAEVTGGVPVAPIALLDTERIVVTLRRDDGTPVAEIADDTVTARRLDPGSGDGEALRWREIEIEVEEAGSTAGEAAARLLTEAGARPARSASKLGRLLGR